MSITIANVVPRVAREKIVEKYLVREIAKIGGTAYKFVSEQHRGVTDRLCVLPNRVVLFVECKRPGKEPTPAQWRELERLREKGQLATWVSTKEEVDYMINRVKPKGLKLPFLSAETLREDGR